MVGKKKRVSSVKVLTPRQKYIIEEKTRVCLECGIAPTPENFENISLWNSYGRVDNYLEGMKETCGEWNKVNNYILYCCKPERKALSALEINAIMREAGIVYEQRHLS